MATPSLTHREAEVLTLWASGLSMAEVASELYLSRCTVKNHCANVTRKLGVSTTLEAVVIAVRDGLIASPSPTTTTPEVAR